MSSRETAGEGAVHRSLNKTTALLVPQNVTLDVRLTRDIFVNLNALSSIAYCDRIKPLIKHK
jgi:hypothetical protein